MMYVVNKFNPEVKEVEDISTLDNVVFVFEAKKTAETFAEEQCTKRIAQYQKHIDKIKEKRNNKNK